MFAPPSATRPSWLPLRLWLGGAVMAALFLFAQGGTGSEVTRLLLGLPTSSGLAPFAFFTPLLHTALLLLLSLCTAFATAFSIAVMSYRLFPSCLPMLPPLGRLIACAPLLGLLWLALHGWISQAGGVIETLLPDRPTGFGESWQESSARLIWFWLAPTLALAVPLAGALVAHFAEVMIQRPHRDLLTGLQARGLPARPRLDQHLLPLWWPLWQQHLSACLFVVLLNTLVVETVLRFPGWGWALVTALQSQDPRNIAAGIYGAGLLAALFAAFIAPTHIAALPATHRLHSSRQKLLARLTFLALSLPILYWLSPSTTRSSWLPDWSADALAVLRIMSLAIIAGPIIAALRLTVLGESLRRYGLLETLLWSPLALWAIIWSQAPGGVFRIDQTLTLVAALALSAPLHTATRRVNATPHLLAAKALGASPWQAWQRHAFKPWLRELSAALLIVAASTWWLRILFYSLFPPAKSSPAASLGSYLAQQSNAALQNPLPLLQATAATAVSLLFLWTLSRIIHSDDDL